MRSTINITNDSFCVQQHTNPQASTVTAGPLEVNDAVHGTFYLGPICSLAEDTAPVQRLRKLKQLGPTCYGPFPGAVHSRHEHSLGVSHLAGRCLQHLACAGAEDVREVDVELTGLAGLCHDLGHGPFSHSFDTFLAKLLGSGHNWHHEAMSCRLLDVVLSQAQLDLDSAQVQHVQDLIDNSQHSSLRQPMHPEHAWRLQIVSNAVNGLDMDKIDYLVRDSLLSGVALQQQCSQFIPLMTQHCKVLSGHVCFDQRQQQQVAAIFDARAELFERVYQHRHAKAAELMIADALVAAEPVLQIRDRIQDAEDFLSLDDSLVDVIQAMASAKGAAPCVQQAAAVLRRLQRRDTMYQWAAEAEFLPQHYHQQRQQQGSKLAVDDVVRCQQQGAAVVLREEDVRLQHYNINYCFGAEDPLERVFLYDSNSNTITKKASVGLDRPGKVFLRNRVRVYVAKQCDTTADLLAYTAAAKAAFCAALRNKCGAAAFKLVEHGTTTSSSSGSGRCIASAASDMRSAAMGMLRGYQPDRLFPQGDVQMGSSSSSSSSSSSPSSSSNSGGFAGGVLDAGACAHRRSAAAAAAPFGAYGNGVVACWAEGAGSQQ